MDSITPSVIPSNGKITVTGQITNASDDLWKDLNVYLLTSEAPFVSGQELEEAQATDPTAEIGARLTAAELYDPIGDLQPGSSAGYTLSVDRDDLEVSGEAGVYWLGVHVLAANREGRDTVADGRARTFVPLMERGGPRTSLSVVMPVKADVQRRPNGKLERLRTWQELLTEEGRLGRLLQLSGTSRNHRLTWVVDPAVMDAVSSVAIDNPSRRSVRTQDSGQDRGESGGSGGERDEGPSDGASDGAGDETGDGAGDGAGDEPGEGPGDAASGQSDDEPSEAAPGADRPSEVSPQAEVAASWLDTFRRQAGQHTVLTVPYSDLDVASTLRLGFVGLYRDATELSADAMQELGIEAQPVVAPANGFLPRPVFPRMDPEQDVLLSGTAAPGAPSPAVLTPRGQRLVLADVSTLAGGPGPTPPYRALALRQRILAEAAVHALGADRDEPLVVTTPQLWDPGSDWRSAEFFAGLKTPWLRSVDLPAVAADGGPSDRAERDFQLELVYPPAARRAELAIENALAAEALDKTGEVYANLLSQDRTVDELLSRSAMHAVGWGARAHPDSSAELARRTTTRVEAVMERVRIEGPSFVTMSSEEGTFAITLVNDLEEPVTVGVRAVTRSSQLKIPSPEPISLGPGQRASVRLRANASDIGVHSVILVPTNGDGQTLGSPARFNVRASEVGQVIWAVMGVGAAVLFLAIAVRLVNRLRGHRPAR